MYPCGCHCGQLGCIYLQVSSAAWLVPPCFNTSHFDLLALCMYLSLAPFVDSGKPLQFFIAILNFNPGPQYAPNPPGLVWWADFVSMLYSIIRVTSGNIKLKQAPNRPRLTLLKMNFQFDEISSACFPATCAPTDEWFHLALAVCTRKSWGTHFYMPHSVGQLLFKNCKKPLLNTLSFSADQCWGLQWSWVCNAPSTQGNS